MKHDIYLIFALIALFTIAFLCSCASKCICPLPVKQESKVIYVPDPSLPKIAQPLFEKKKVKVKK